MLSDAQSEHMLQSPNIQRLTLNADNTTVLELTEIASKTLDTEECKEEILRMEHELRCRLNSVSKTFATNSK